MLIGSWQKWNTFNMDSRLLLSIVILSVKQAEFTKSLGVYIDENLTWNVQIEHIFKTIASCIGILRRSRSRVPFHSPIQRFSSTSFRLP